MTMVDEQETTRPESEDELYQPAPRQEGFVKEIWGFLKVRKKFWLAPIILALVLLSALLVLASSAGVVSPFIYAL
jgi:hypothetical protein